MNKPFSTVLIGCGQVASGYGFDPQYKKFYRYATHADVLAKHPDFKWVAAVDPVETARGAVTRHYPAVDVAPTLAELPAGLPAFEVAVMATPPDVRLALLDQLPSTIKAIIVEKPLGQTVAECEAFLELCRKRNIRVQVNLWRRVDELHRSLTGSVLRKQIGEIQGINIVYTGGLRTTATHIIDWIEMMAGPIVTAQATKESALLTCASGVVATLLALNVTYFRELTCDVWGTTGRLTIGNEALHVATRVVTAHRAMGADTEIAADSPGQIMQPTVGEAYYHLYTNLAEALLDKAPLLAEGDLALRAATIIAAIEESSAADGRAIRV